MADATARRDRFADGDASGSVGDAHAVEVETFAVIRTHQSVATMVAERLDPTLHRRYEPSDPCRSTDTISSAVVAASRPLLFSSFAERSSA